MSRAVILSVSPSPALLQTRSHLLRRAGYRVADQSSIDAAAKEFLDGDFDAVILCHSIAADQRTRLIKVIRSHSPSTSILIVSGRFGESDPRVDAVVENDPEVLLSGVAAALAGSANSRRAMPKPAGSAY